QHGVIRGSQAGTLPLFMGLYQQGTAKSLGSLHSPQATSVGCAIHQPIGVDFLDGILDRNRQYSGSTSLRLLQESGNLLPGDKGSDRIVDQHPFPVQDFQSFANTVLSLAATG